MKLDKKDIALIATSTTAGVFIAISIIFIVLYAKNQKNIQILHNNLNLTAYSGGQEDFTIAVVNESNILSDEEVSNATVACQIQINRDFYPIWDLNAHLVFYSNSQKSQIPSNNMQLIVIDNADVADALGYHTLTATGMPLAKVFVETSQQAGTPWTLAFSHELLEMIADPWANLTVFVQTGNTSGAIVSYEVCDPCQALANSYQINGVVVSDFVLPQWFGFYTSGNTFDFQGYITQPATILPGGYALAFQVPNSNNNGYQIINGVAGQLTTLQGGNAGTVMQSMKAPPHCTRVKERHVKQNNNKGIHKLYRKVR
jgi:hypothetical protein